MNFPSAIRADFLLECSLLPAMRVLRAVPFGMLVNALPGELFLAVWACSTGLESNLRCALPTMFAFVWIVAVM